MPSTLPIELILIIIDFLFDDRKSLANFSLAGTDYVEAARFHLFTTLSINLKNETIFDILLTPQNTIAPAARRVSLRIQKARSHPIRGQAIPDVLVERMSLAFATLKNIQSLDLRDFAYEDWDLAPTFLACFPRITKLSLSYGFTDDLRPLIILFYGFPQLNNLFIDRITQSNGAEEPRLPYDRLSFPLRTLSIKSSWCHNLLPWILSLPLLPRLSTLNIRIDSSSTVEEIAALILRLKGSLVDLHISFGMILPGMVVSPRGKLLHSVTR